MTEPLRAADPQRLGPYRFVGRLGRGGMGTVYLAEDGAGGQVAVKVINAELADDPAFHERFRREVTAARQVRRFSTAAVLDAQLDGEPLYVVTEYVEGPSLEQAVDEGGPMRGGALEGLAVGIATALGAVHGAGIVHRDLKPSNVLLSSTGPRVIDFGIARALDSADGPTRTGQFIGTPAYIAPELMRGEEVTPAADVFAWGCVVAYAGTGRAPFAGANVPEVLYHVAHDPPVLDGLDPDLHGVVAAALDKDPRNRPTTREILARLVGQADPSPERLAETVEAAWPEPGSTTRPPPTRPGPATRPGARVPPTQAAHPARRRRPKRHLSYFVPGGLVPLAIFGLVWAVGDRGDGGGGRSGSGVPAAASAIVGKETFDKAGTGWPASCGSYENGAYAIEVRAGEDDRRCAIPRQRAAMSRRYLYDVRIELRSGPDNNRWDAGLALAGDPQGLDHYQVVIRPNGRISLREKVGGRLHDLESRVIDDHEAGSANRLQVLLDQSGDETEITAWVNGKKELDHSDDERPLAAGTASLLVNRPASTAGAMPALARFDDFSLSEPDPDEW
ncbi:serine/threonine-protein kinase [Spirillospora sp. NPDC047279]|uniref:serine/threonine-protein kinase n=1 Tax=Spirillospora sp. NPDC047279 TaxID=3155478 RepID=UPI0033DDFD53